MSSHTCRRRSETDPSLLPASFCRSNRGIDTEGILQDKEAGFVSCLDGQSCDFEHTLKSVPSHELLVQDNGGASDASVKDILNV